MSGETGDHVSGWTTDTLRSLLNERDRLYSELRQADKDFATERDRRYAEVALEREKALKIKETADLAALGLAREIQDYKDEKANKLREQIEGERGDYATKADLLAAVAKIDAVVLPVVKYVDSQQGRSSGLSSSYAALMSALIALAALASFVAYIATH